MHDLWKGWRSIRILLGASLLLTAGGCGLSGEEEAETEITQQRRLVVLVEVRSGSGDDWEALMPEEDITVVMSFELRDSRGTTLPGSIQPTQCITRANGTCSHAFTYTAHFNTETDTYREQVRVGVVVTARGDPVSDSQIFSPEQREITFRLALPAPS